MTSFSSQVKTELCGAVRKPADRANFLRGLLLASRHREGMLLQTESEALANMLPKLIAGTMHVSLTTAYRTRCHKHPLWMFHLQEDETLRLMEKLDIADGMPSCTGRALAMLAAGCFVVSGSVANPERRYHLEILLHDEIFAAKLQAALASGQPSIPMKTILRKGEPVLYLKQNEQICDALAFFGASNAALMLAEQQVYKSFMSQTNRRTNCDLANIDKTVAASETQLADIALIAEKMGLDALPAPLREVAGLRLHNPNISLRELASLCNPPLSRSGLHHRLSKLSAIAKGLRE